MGLNIYFQENNGDDIEGCDNLSITHNLNTLVQECGILTNNKYYELVWRPNELLDDPTELVSVEYVMSRLPNLINDLIVHENELVQYLPSNGWGTYNGLISFLCDYLKNCHAHKDKFIYCCR